MSEDKLASASTATAAQLIEEFKRCTPWSNSVGNRMTDNEDVRFTKWLNQWPDGKKHGTPQQKAVPWENASDTRVPLADSIINENVAILSSAFFRAMIRPKGGSSEAGNYAVKLVDHLVNTRLFHDLLREVELAAQYRETYGWIVLKPGWETRIKMVRRWVTEGELMAVAAEAGEDAALILQAAIKSGQLVDDAIGILQNVYRAYLRDEIIDKAPRGPAAALEKSLKPLSDRKARQALQTLRDRGEAQVAIPVIVRNQPRITALKPWEEVFVPEDVTDIETARVIFHRDFLSEGEVRARGATEGWDPEWIDEAIKHKGQITSWRSWSHANAQSGIALATTISEGRNWELVDQKTDLVEVIYAVYQSLDEDGVPGIYYKILHPAVSTHPTRSRGADFCAAGGLLEDGTGEMPYVAGCRENYSRSLTSSRGIPETAARTWQREIKVQRDACVDLTSLAVLPPLLVPQNEMGYDFNFGPAVQNSVTRGREPKMMDIPTHGGKMGMALEDRIERDADIYFGRISSDVHPARIQVKQQMLVEPFLAMWSEVFQRVVRLSQQHMPDEEFAAVTGAPVGWLEQNRDNLLPGVDMRFDVRELDYEFVMKQFEVINNSILPADTEGLTNRSEYVRFQYSRLNPWLAKDLVMEQSDASKQLHDTVKNDIAQMFLGNAPELVENDSTAQAKLQFATQIIQANPNYQQALQQEGGLFAQQMQVYVQNLSQSIAQEQNKSIGRYGVSPSQAKPTA